MTTKDFRLAFGTALVCVFLLTEVMPIGLLGVLWCAWATFFTNGTTEKALNLCNDYIDPERLRELEEGNE